MWSVLTPGIPKYDFAQDLSPLPVSRRTISPGQDIPKYSMISTQPHLVRQTASGLGLSLVCRLNLIIFTVESRKMSEETSTRRAILTVTLIFIASLTALSYVYMSFPELAEEEKEYMKLPFHIEDAKNLGKLLGRYKDLYYFEVLAALLLVCTCSAVGATLCYLLSSLLGRKLLYKYFPEKANEWTVMVAKHRDHLLNYMLFLRMTPLLPNWFINLASPVIGVPIIPFTVGTFFGVAPPSFVAIQAGQTLHNLTSSSDAWSWNKLLAGDAFYVPI
ncbi:hypothetical protein HZH68_010388 [Vespula germanica]|uniref:VTT domain-containing protein n=1 Tax=Vespula germanica TaxID=30212 RepID=A0A834JV77_VESGE|nr:hypothetical protein HZH68_010388 [Vespula germanica]